MARSPCAVAALLIICFAKADAFGLFGWIGFDVRASALERYRAKGVVVEHVYVVDLAVAVVVLGVARLWGGRDLAFALGFPITPTIGGFKTRLFPCFAVSTRFLGGRVERLWGSRVAREWCLFWLAGTELIDQPVAIVVLEIAADLKQRRGFLSLARSPSTVFAGLCACCTDAFVLSSNRAGVAEALCALSARARGGLRVHMSIAVVVGCLGRGAVFGFVGDLLDALVIPTASTAGVCDALLYAKSAGCADTSECSKGIEQGKAKRIAWISRPSEGSRASLITGSESADLIAWATFVDKAVTVVVFVVAFFGLWEDGLVALAKGLIGGTTLYACLTKAVTEISGRAIRRCLVLGKDATHTFLAATNEEAATFLFGVDGERALP